MLASPAKRVAVFLLVNAIELGNWMNDKKEIITHILEALTKLFVLSLSRVGIIIALSIVGVGYLLTSDDVQDLLMNSVSIVFILQIDDMARDAFQGDDINDHIDGMEFERTMKSPKMTDMSLRGKIKVPKWSAYKTFWSLDKAVMTFVAALLCVYPCVYYKCW